MNTKAISFIKSFSYSLVSNLIALLVSSLVILIIPKLIGIEAYGYWQLYLFYSSYIGFLHFGWSDGIYLRFGGEKYNDLNKNLFFSQFWMLFISQFFLFSIIFFYSIYFVTDSNKSFIILMTGICMLVSNTRIILVHILQSTNRIKEYAVTTMLDRISYLFFIVLIIFSSQYNYKYMIIADILGKLCSLIYVSYLCKDIVFRNIKEFHLDIREMFINISVGIKLMFANIASILIIGIVRFSIEKQWDIATFGKISLTLSVSNLMMVFINAMGIIMFPILRRANKKNLPTIYSTMRNMLMVMLLGILIFYYPFKSMLSLWLPQYADSLKYMALVFPMSLYEGKMSLLINTYLKTLRKEKFILKVNLLSVVLSLITTIVTVFILKNLTLSVLSIVFLLAFRCIISELFLARYLNISVIKDISVENLLVVVFIYSGWVIQGSTGCIIYIVAFFLYLLYKKKEIYGTVNEIKTFVKK